MTNRKDYHKAYYQAHKEQQKANMKAYRESHKEENKAKKKAWREVNKDKVKAYIEADLNYNGETKHSIRMQSQRILKRMNLYIPGYEIHHCFGYEDPSKFIYINRALHLKIHQYLRDNDIDASHDHWMAIRELVNESDEFMYIKC